MNLNPVIINSQIFLLVLWGEKEMFRNSSLNTISKLHSVMAIKLLYFNIAKSNNNFLHHIFKKLISK